MTRKNLPVGIQNFHEVRDELFKNKKLDLGELHSFGFREENGRHIYSTKIVNGQFQMLVAVANNGMVTTKVIDLSSDEEYVLHHMPETVGSFVGAVRTDFENVLRQIGERCFESNIFKSDYAQKIIQYVRDAYHDELEFLWPKFPQNAIFRRRDTVKWYGALLVLSKRKLGIDSDDIVDILDLRMSSNDIESTVDHKKYYPGYHMNKKHWVTICLDGSVPVNEIFEQIDASYKLASK
ncbi:MAG: MmcQ/YjbR family DNA-binding protein [Zoogloeaceae bacterium]|jgi:predicted DNA-binding protein (MmcQ/YjbR family)|nr:MmcQ/YjbR family DNA-binding protein [Zoogloeaceae bacterium]